MLNTLMFFPVVNCACTLCLKLIMSLLGIIQIWLLMSGHKLSIFILIVLNCCTYFGYCTELVCFHCSISSAWRSDCQSYGRPKYLLKEGVICQPQSAAGFWYSLEILPASIYSLGYLESILVITKNCCFYWIVI